MTDRSDRPERYELVFRDPADTLVVRRTEREGPGGHPVYADDSGIVQAEISDRGEVRMLATGGHQTPGRPTARELGLSP
jgi:Family of unknown function (DUF6296)